MQRWALESLVTAGRERFKKLVKRYRLAHPNHEIHFLARDKEDWLLAGCQSLLAGIYVPYFIKRLHVKDETIDQLTIPDRIFQWLLLQQIKTTFKHVINPHCYHIEGPNGVRRATRAILTKLNEKKPAYIIRADIKSFYRSIPHTKLLQTLKQAYQDPRVHRFFEQIIRNPIETPRGYKNPDHGIPIRGPLSPFFSALYLKPLDDAFTGTEVSYYRYQDDILILCQTKRQYQCSRRRLSLILKERQLNLSSKKTRMGRIEKGFHYLGIDYPGTQTRDKKELPAPHLHRRTLRNARLQVKQMVTDGFSALQIKTYLRRWTSWWEQVLAAKSAPPQLAWSSLGASRLPVRASLPPGEEATVARSPRFRHAV